MVYTGEVYLSKTLPNRIHLQHEFYTFKMVDTRSMDENLDDFLNIVSYLSSVNVTVSEEVQAIMLLNLLPSRFNSLKKTLKYGMDTLSLKEVTSAARSKDQNFKTSTDSQDNGERYYARGRTEKKDPVKNDKGNSISSSGSRITCWFCRKKGHTKRKCYAYKKMYGRGEDEAETTVVIDTESEDDALSVSDRLHHDKWLIDYECSYHMTCRRDRFHTFQELSG
ncbi:hypothetical protein YC2023_051263 [Brassica napus]